jgi:hypothetical protein
VDFWLISFAPILRFLSDLCKDIVHILGHWVAIAQVLCGTVGSLLVRIQSYFVLLEEFLLDRHVVVDDAQYYQPVFRSSQVCGCLLCGVGRDGVNLSVASSELVGQFILDQV